MKKKSTPLYYQIRSFSKKEFKALEVERYKASFLKGKMRECPPEHWSRSINTHLPWYIDLI